MTVVVAAMGDRTGLDRTVGALLADPAGLDVLVVDHLEDTGAFSRRQSVDPDGRVRFRTEPEPSRSAARNRGLCWSRSDLVAFLDEGCVPSASWAGAIVDAFRADSSLACVVGPVFPRASEPGRSSTGEARSVFEFGNGHAPWPQVDLDQVLASGADNLTLRKSLLPDLWAFDPDLGPGSATGAGDDVDVIVDLLGRGLRVAFVPEARIDRTADHDTAATRRTARTEIGLGAVILKRALAGDRHTRVTSPLAGIRSVGQVRDRLIGPATYAGSRFRRSWKTA